MKKYVLVKWPESQVFLTSDEECYFIERNEIEFDYLVPEDLYNDIFNIDECLK